MTTTAFLLLTLTLAVAVVDWAAVAADRRGVEYVAKPLTMVGLIGVALTLDPVSQVVLGAFLVALVLSLVGDVALLRPGDGSFMVGLGAFLAAHVAYVVGLVARGVTLSWLAVGLVVVAGAVVVVGRPIVQAVRRGSEGLAAPVVAYLVVISAMVVVAIGSRNPFAIVGGLLFYASDATLAWNRFVTPHRWGRVAVMVTYHLGQMGLVLSLI